MDREQVPGRQHNFNRIGPYRSEIDCCTGSVKYIFQMEQQGMLQTSATSNWSDTI